MCGIAGFWTPENEPDAGRNVKKMTEALHHRGPDGYGYHINKNLGLAMGHSRLAINGRDSGKQPMVASKGQLILTVNGEFYDFKEIRTSLSLDGFNFLTKSDSEIALYLYQKYGLSFIEHLRGDFALALFDTKKQQLILARDRFGVKPLFYHANEKGVYWGSEMKSLFQHPDITAVFDPKGIIHQFLYITVPGTTLFKNIQTVEPGHILVIHKESGNRTSIHPKKYWDFDFPKKSERDPSKSKSSFIPEIQDEIIDAVKVRLEADVKLGCYLSGGIDSCIALGLASSISQTPLEAFTIGFKGGSPEEVLVSKKMAQHARSRQNILYLDHEQLYNKEFYEKALWHSERTFYNTLGVSKIWMNKKIIDSGCRIMLTGEGSDELFGGYNQFKNDLLRYDIDSTYSNGISKLRLNQLMDSQISHPVMDNICGFTPSWIQPWIRSMLQIKPILHDKILHELKDYDPVEAIANSMDASQLEGRHVLDIAQYTWSKNMLRCHLGWGGDRMDMESSIESRPIFLDHHLVNITKKIPPNLRIKNGTEKWILREAMKKLLPKVVSKRDKFPFKAPNQQQRDVSSINYLIDTYLNEEVVKESELFDFRRLSQFINDYKNGNGLYNNVNKDAFLNYILGLQILHNQYIKKTT